MGSLGLFAAYANVCQRHGDALAVVDAAGRHRYRDIAARAERLAALLRAAGVGKGSVVTIEVQPGHQLVSALLAAWSRGGVAALVTPDLTQADRAHILALLRPTALVSDTGPRDGAVVTAGVSGSRGLRPGNPQENALVLFTSGTTGRPKGIVHTARSLMAAVCITAAVQAEALGQDVEVPETDHDLERTIHSLADQRLGLTFMTGMPLRTMAGLTVLQRALLMGECLVAPPSADPETMWSYIESERVTTMSLSPFLAQRLARYMRVRRLGPAPGLAMIGIGAGPTPAHLPPQLEELSGAVVAVGYGSTELGGPALMGRMSDPAQVRWNTVGRPLPGVEVRLAPLDVPSEPRAIGRLQCRSRSLMIGYLDQADGSPFTGDGWYETGDLAEPTGDGQWRIVGRASGLIVRGGLNIDPVMVEHRLECHEDVLEAGVVGLPGLIAGEEDIVAAIVSRSSDFDVQALRAHCQDALPLLAVPRLFVGVHTIPRTADGGVRRHELRRLIAPPTQE